MQYWYKKSCNTKILIINIISNGFGISISGIALVIGVIIFIAYVFLLYLDSGTHVWERLKPLLGGVQI